MMIPWEATMVPNFLTVQNLDGLIVFRINDSVFCISFWYFLLRQQFKTIPNELYEASHSRRDRTRSVSFGMLYFLCLKQVLVTLGVYSFLTTWNMYLWPLLVTTNENVSTVQIGLKQMQSQEISTDWGVVMAAVRCYRLTDIIYYYS